MDNNNYRISITPNASAEQVYNSITREIPEWWTEDFEGASGYIDEVFTVRFGSTYKTFKIEDAIPNERIVWLCLDALIDTPELENKTEWIGTRIVWDIIAGENTELKVTHIGLTPDVECYKLCQQGWKDFVAGSLLGLLNNGKGSPYKP
jgi:hypothetical protein